MGGNGRQRDWLISAHIALLGVTRNGASRPDPARLLALLCGSRGSSAAAGHPHDDARALLAAAFHGAGSFCPRSFHQADKRGGFLGRHLRVVLSTPRLPTHKQQQARFEASAQRL